MPRKTSFFRGRLVKAQSCSQGFLKKKKKRHRTRIFVYEMPFFFFFLNKIPHGNVQTPLRNRYYYGIM